MPESRRYVLIGETKQVIIAANQKEFSQAVKKLPSSMREYAENINIERQK
jgi:hypothetical protein